MTVSILVPVYNVEQWIERCARSLFEQTYPKLEYIFINDGTPDKSIDILKKVINDYPLRKGDITIINNKQNYGVAYCRDAAIGKARGDFVCFVDSDDWLEHDAIEYLVKEQTITNADVVWGNALIHYLNHDVEIKEPHYANKQEWLMSYCRLNGYMMVTWRRIIRRSLFIKNNIKTIKGCNYAEDQLLMTQVAFYAEGFSSVDKIVYHYNQMNDTSLTARGRGKEFKSDIFNQEVQNILAIESFWSKKDSFYFETMVKAKMCFLMKWLKIAYRSSSRSGYNLVIGHINDTDHRFYPIIGFDNWKQRMVYSNYFFFKTYMFIKEHGHSNQH